jgi:hypothetical protein
MPTVAVCSHKQDTLTKSTEVAYLRRGIRIQWNSQFITRLQRLPLQFLFFLFSRNFLIVSTPLYGQQAVSHANGQEAVIRLKTAIKTHKFIHRFDVCWHKDHVLHELNFTS